MCVAQLADDLFFAVRENECAQSLVSVCAMGATECSPPPRAENVDPQSTAPYFFPITGCRHAQRSRGRPLTLRDLLASIACFRCLATLEVEIQLRFHRDRARWNCAQVNCDPAWLAVWSEGRILSPSASRIREMSLWTRRLDDSPCRDCASDAASPEVLRDRELDALKKKWPSLRRELGAVSRQCESSSEAGCAL